MAINNEEVNTMNETELKRIYYENFIEELNDEELMYKKTVEDLFYIYKSFGFIYSIIKKANLLLSKENFDTFLKSLVSFIDELFLYNPSLFNNELNNGLNVPYVNKDNILPNKKRKYPEDTGSNDINNMNDMNDINNVNNLNNLNNLNNMNNMNNEKTNEHTSFMNNMSKTYVEELIKDIKNIDDNFSETNCSDFLYIVKNILKMKNTSDIECVKNRFEKIKNVLNIGKSIFDKKDILYDMNDHKKKAHEYIDDMYTKLNNIEPIIISIIYKQNFWYNNILNKSEYDSINSILNLNIDVANEKIEEVYTEVLLLLSEEMTQNKDLHFAKEKLERLKTSYDAEIQRKLQQEMELTKKLDDKRKAVQFIIDRYNEYTWFDKNSPKKHSFYILGINPKNITEEQLKSFGKRLKVNFN